ncbi:MAG: UDP-N-acetylmuramoyl-L-alanine--D-glutamate ligase [Spirochaetia bacterium]|nr:UDP-N-acetylmuramoyl-L-alanine--D-glutamate ligase [Spirochaetia bacterium]
MIIPEGKNILICGAAGNTGRWFSLLLLKKGYTVFAYDKNKNFQPDNILSIQKDYHVVDETEFNNFTILKKVNGITLSPGVPLSQPIFKRAVENNIPVFTEPEFCAPYLNEKKWIAITGTDGKSTTTALITHLLKSIKKEAVSCGNYGIPLSQILVEEEKYADLEFLVMELSSYQLELFRNLKSNAALFLNLADDHINRYENLKEYRDAKWNIIKNSRKEDFFIINTKLLQEVLKEKNHPWNLKNKNNTPNVIEINCENIKSENFNWQNNTLFYKNKEKLLTTNNLQISGNHNLTNILFALETIKAILPNTGVTEYIHPLKNFRPLPHRFEIIHKEATDDKNRYINDSKATTGQAVLKALESIDPPFFIFMGGQSKGEDYTVLAKNLRKKYAIVFLFGKDKHILEKIFINEKVIVQGSYEILTDAFLAAKEYQKKESIEKATYLLSPAMTSWDQYKNFEERGNHFRNLVLEE